MGVVRGRRRSPFFGIGGALSIAALAATALASTEPRLRVVDIPSGTHVRFHVNAPLSSNESKTGQRFGFILVEPIVVAGQVVAPAGDGGEGTVLLAGPAGMKGHEGDLTLRIDFVEEADGSDVVFDNQHFEINGTNAKAASALAGFIPIVGFFAQFMRGQDEHLGVNHEIETVLDRPASILTAPEEPACVATPSPSPSPSLAPNPLMTPYGYTYPSPSSSPSSCDSPAPIALVTPFGYAYPSPSPSISPSASPSH